MVVNDFGLLRPKRTFAKKVRHRERLDQLSPSLPVEYSNRLYSIPWNGFRGNRTPAEGWGTSATPEDAACIVAHQGAIEHGYARRQRSPTPFGRVVASTKTDCQSCGIGESRGIRKVCWRTWPVPLDRRAGGVRNAAEACQERTNVR